MPEVRSCLKWEAVGWKKQAEAPSLPQNNMEASAISPLSKGRSSFCCCFGGLVLLEAGNDPQRFALSLNRGLLEASFSK